MSHTHKLPIKHKCSLNIKELGDLEPYSVSLHLHLSILALIQLDQLFHALPNLKDLFGCKINLGVKFLVKLLTLPQYLSLFDILISQKLQILLGYFELLLHKFEFIGRLPLQSDHILIITRSLLKFSLKFVLKMDKRQQLLLDNTIALLDLYKL